mgnify:CR=1 FL=1
MQENMVLSMRACGGSTAGTAADTTAADTAAATALIVKRPEIFRDYEITKGKMDDVFLTVTGKKLTGDENK